MVALNFQKQFADDVAAGRKRQTIRAAARCKPGDALQLYTGQRTKSCRKLRDAVCASVTPIRITETGVVILSEETPDRDISLDEFAIADGFKDYAEMWAWFSSRYGVDGFTGYLIKW